MYIESVPNRNSPPAVLLREAYRDGGKVRKRTLANLSCLSAEVIEGLRVLLKGGVAVPSAEGAFTVERSLPHGHVAAALGSAIACGAPDWFDAAPEPLRRLLLAMVVARIVSPAAKPAIHRMLSDDTAAHSLGRVLGLGKVEPEELYRALDWLHAAQPGIERRLARKHAPGDTVVLYQLNSSGLTGRCPTPPARGPARDGRRDDVQLAFGLICTVDGCPLAVEAFADDTTDATAAWAARLKARLGVEQIAWVSDRGEDAPAPFRNHEAGDIAVEGALGGLRVIRTSLHAAQLAADGTVAANKRLSQVEQAFHSIRCVDAHIPPFHYSAERVRGHVLLCMLAHYVEWHMRSRLKPMLFDDEVIEATQAARPPAATTARRAEHARSEATAGHADARMPLHSFRTLMEDLSTLAYNVTHTALNPKAKIVLTTQPTPLQSKAFTLLEVNPARTR